MEDEFLQTVENSKIEIRKEFLKENMTVDTMKQRADNGATWLREHLDDSDSTSVKYARNLAAYEVLCDLLSELESIEKTGMDCLDAIFK